MAIAVYPGTFDPFTSGHEDLVRRASGIFEEVVVGVADSRAKGTLFTFEERLSLARGVLESLPNVRVDGFAGLALRLDVLPPFRPGVIVLPHRSEFGRWHERRGDGVLDGAALQWRGYPQRRVDGSGVQQRAPRRRNTRA